MPPLVRALTENWKLKLLAFVLAILLWVVVSAEQVTSRWIGLPLEVRVTDPQYQLVSASVPREVQVRFAGPGREFVDLALRRPPLVLNVPDVDEAEQTFALDPRMVRLPSRSAVDPQRVEPAAVTLRFLRVESRSIPVVPRVGSGPGVGYMLADGLSVQPQRIRVSGPADRLEGLDSLYTLPLELSPDDSGFTREVRIDGAGLAGLRLSQTRVQVSGAVDRISEHTLMDVPISVGGGVIVRPTSANVQFTGPQRIVQPLRLGDFRVVVSIDSIPSQIPPEGLLVPLRVERAPRGVRAQVAPARVRLMPSAPDPETPALLGDTVPAAEGASR